MTVKANDEKRDLCTLYPEIAAEWNYEKNEDLKPEMFLPGSGKRVWWKCAYGHEWKTAIYHRTSGHGCKICASRRSVLKVGINDLVTRCPELSAEWDYEKNDPLMPSDVPLYSKATVWWKCIKGHSWKNTVSHRTQGQGCPYCGGNKILSGYNDMVTLRVPYLSEWDYEKNHGLCPDKFGPGSEEKVWWKCEQGHFWKSAIYSRTAGRGCPYCAGNRLVPGTNDIASTSPEIAGEWDYAKNEDITPDMVARTTTKAYWWLCHNGHSYKSSPGMRSKGCGCPYCAGKKVLKGFNDFESKHPELMKEWDWDKNKGIFPDMIPCNSHRKIWWIDSLGHSWETTTSSRINGNGCPYCAGHAVLKGYNDLASIKPELLGEWDCEKNDSIKPEAITAGSHHIVWWKCKLGHSWKSMVGSRTVRNTGCPYCSNVKVLKGFNDFEHFHPELLGEWNYKRNHGISPSDYTYGSHKLVWWTCPIGHEYKRRLCERHSGKGCPYCAGSKVLEGFNDLKTRTPWIAEAWDYERNRNLKPEDVFPYTNRKVWWVCKNGHHWRAKINAKQRGIECPYCHGQIPGKTHFIT